MSIRIGIGIDNARYGDLIDPQAQAFYDRVIADGGANAVVPTGLIGLSATFKAVKAIYGVSDITQALSVFYDAHYLAYKKGTGVGATAGRAIEKLYSACGASGDSVQTTLASQPLLLEHSGTNYVYLSGINGNYFSSPSAVANRFRNDIDYKICVQANSYTTAFDFIGRYSSTAINRGFTLDITATGLLRLYFRFGGDVIVSSTASLASVGITAGTQVWLRATRNANNGEIKFFYSLNTFTTAPLAVTWTQLGTTVISTTGTTIGTSDTPIGIGTYTPEVGASTLVGRIYRATMSGTIDGAAVVDFNPNNYVAATSQSTWTSSTGEVWTRNRDSATTGLKAAIVDYTILMSNGTSHAMQAASFNFDTAEFTNYTTFAKFNNTVTTIVSELGVDAATASGYYHATNEGAFNTDGVSIYGNVGQNGSSFLNNSTLLQLATLIGDTTIASPETSYFSNNVAATLNSTYASANNTGNMNGTALNLFARNAGVGLLFFNGSFRNLLLAKQSDNTTIRTNVYNLIRTNYNNAF